MNTNLDLSFQINEITLMFLESNIQKNSFLSLLSRSD